MREFFENVYAMVYCGYLKTDATMSYIMPSFVISYFFMVHPLILLGLTYTVTINPALVDIVINLMPTRYGRVNAIIVGLITQAPLMYLVERYYSSKRDEITKRWNSKKNKSLRIKTRVIFWSYMVLIFGLTALIASRHYWMPILGITPLA